ncbi:MAG: hypothetical protein Sapg2KO_47190 [Saprospiraceae bacterium]
MKVLYLGNFLNNVKGRYDGPNVQVVKVLQSHGHKVKWAGTSGSQLHRLAQFILAILKAKLGKTELIIIDVFSTRAFYFATISGSLARLFKINYALVLHGGNLPVRFRSSHNLSQKLLRKASLVFSPSNYLATAAKSAFEVDVKVIPNRIEVRLNREEVKRENQLFWVRSLSSIYNPEMAIEVLKYITEAGLDFKLIFIGPGDSERIIKVKRLIKKYNLDNKVEIKGRMAREDWHNLARNGKYFLNTTYVDNTPSSVIEAMALGLVPISTNVGGLPFILDNKEDSILVEPNHASEMASYIVALEKDQAELVRLRENGRQKFLETYADKKISEEWRKALTNI